MLCGTVIPLQVRHPYVRCEPIEIRRPSIDDIYRICIIYIHTYGGGSVAGTLTSIRLDTHLADEAAKLLGVKTRTEAIHIALREMVALKRFKALMKKNAGKLKFAGFRG